jgi:3'(2'), 5'-bisphosphate nucleotidase
MAMADAALCESIIALACEAAARILAVYEGDFTVTHKDDRSPLTAADLAAHHCIVQGLEQLTPDIPVLSEESAQDVPTLVRRQWRRMWLVDPLDGTREFVKRNGEFTVNIALIDEGIPVLAVVQAPVTGVVWHACRGHGTFRRDGAKEVRLQTCTPATAPLRVAASRSHRDALDTIALGSSLKFCRLAEGGMDVYPRFGPTSEWDTAAGQCVLEAAGGAVIDLKGRPLRYNQRDTILNGDFLALGDPALPWQSWVG